jgi:hypothetical protein
MNDLIITNIIKGVNCKACDFVQIEQEIPSKMGGYYYRLHLAQQEGLNTTLMSRSFYSNINPLFGLNETYNLVDSESISENKIVEIQINNTVGNKEVVID